MLAYCTLSGFLASIVISGLLFSLDFISKTPPGTFFAVIGSSLGFYDSNTSPYVGLLLHFATGTVAGNLLGQGGIFWNRLIPFGLRRGTILGVITGISLWLVLFLPLTTYIIQPKLDMFNFSAPNQYIFVIAQHFKGLNAVVVIGSFFFPYYLWNNLRINRRKTYRIKREIGISMRTVQYHLHKLEKWVG